MIVTTMPNGNVHVTCGMYGCDRTCGICTPRASAPDPTGNYCTKCACYFTTPGTCNCYAVRTYWPAGRTIEDPTRNCSCRPENGGNGACFCVRGQTMTWSA